MKSEWLSHWLPDFWNVILDSLKASLVDPTALRMEGKAYTYVLDEYPSVTDAPRVGPLTFLIKNTIKDEGSTALYNTY